MTGLDIEAIHKRSEEVQRFREDPSSALAHHNFLAATADSAADVPVLLAEIERLQAELAGARAALADALQVIADLRGETP